MSNAFEVFQAVDASCKLFDLKVIISHLLIVNNMLTMVYIDLSSISGDYYEDWANSFTLTSRSRFINLYILLSMYDPVHEF